MPYIEIIAIQINYYFLLCLFHYACD